MKGKGIPLVIEHRRTIYRCRIYNKVLVVTHISRLHVKYKCTSVAPCGVLCATRYSALSPFQTGTTVSNNLEIINPWSTANCHYSILNINVFSLAISYRTLKTFLLCFLDVQKRTLQNISNILKKCFLDNISYNIAV